MTYKKSKQTKLLNERASSSHTYSDDVYESKMLDHFSTFVNIRQYQLSIFRTAKSKNTLVVLPTGLGKTLIALMLAYYRLSKYGGKVLMLAPTRPLVQQHFNSFEKFNFDVGMLTGQVSKKKRQAIWEKCSVIVATPQTIANALKHKLISLANVCLVVFDEAHRCIKNYDYVFIADRYMLEAKHKRIIGLTASPGNDKSTLQQICSNLRIQSVEIRTRQSSDVKPYIKQLDVELYKVKLSNELLEVVELLKQMYKKRIEELKARSLLFEKPTKTNLLKLQAKLQKIINSGNTHFNVLRGLSACAQAIKLEHALELAETQTVHSLYNYLKQMLEQASKKTSKAVIQLINQREFAQVYAKVVSLYNSGVEHPKLSLLMQTLHKEIMRNPEFKCIVFSQYRDTATLIAELLAEQGFKASIFIGQAKKRGVGLTQKKQLEILEKFRDGEINILVATSVGEEGLDIPEVDAVFFYEPIPSAIRKIQRAGRTARLKEGKLIILITKNTRDEAYHWAAIHKEKKMYKSLHIISKQFTLSSQAKLVDFVSKSDQEKDKQTKR